MNLRQKLIKIRDKFSSNTYAYNELMSLKSEVSKINKKLDVILSNSYKVEDTENAILPTQQLNNLNFKVDLIMDYFLDPSAARPATGMLRDTQEKMFRIFKIFCEIASQHNLEYWIDYGTLLGAVRHKGFVPWDSDIDISIMEDQLPCFEKILARELPDDLEFVNVWKGYVYRIRRKGTIDEEFIDIYPYYSYGKDERGVDKLLMRKGDHWPHLRKSFGPYRPFPKDIVFPLTHVEFNGIVCRAPGNIDQYLRLKYGDYQLLPKSVHIEAGHPNLDSHIVFYPDDF